MLKKLLCLLLGHKDPRQFFDDDTGDIISACPRCMKPQREADLVYPDEMKNMSPGIAHGPPTLPAAGDVTCSACGKAWHSHHPILGAILCSPCRIKSDIAAIEARMAQMKAGGSTDDQCRPLRLMLESQKDALAELERTV